MCFSREFTHRVKSVSMSKFTSQEVEALQEGGNQVHVSPDSFSVSKFVNFLIRYLLLQRARETFLKDWDPREQRLPDNR